jgi:3-hydroxybutyryl-CoA dehydrogenase
MLANEAADALLQGVASAADIDLAMRAGVNYPQGPLAWADAVGLPHILKTLDNLQAAYGEERYRPSLLLRRRVAEGRNLHD